MHYLILVGAAVALLLVWVMWRKAGQLSIAGTMLQSGRQVVATKTSGLVAGFELFSVGLFGLMLPTVERLRSTPPSVGLMGTMAYCAECGHELPNGAKFCSKCGKPAIQARTPAQRSEETKNCPHCRAQIPADANTCSFCGKPVTALETFTTRVFTPCGCIAFIFLVLVGGFWLLVLIGSLNSR